MATINVSLRVNGQSVAREVEPRTLLVDLIREDLSLTGTHVGCDTSQCGACVVHVNGNSVKSCTIFAWQADGTDVTTIEGLTSEQNLHPMQEAFREHHALQCGFCTPGMIMSAVDLVAKNPSLLSQARRARRRRPRRRRRSARSESRTRLDRGARGRDT